MSETIILDSSRATFTCAKLVCRRSNWSRKRARGRRRGGEGSPAIEKREAQTTIAQFKIQPSAIARGRAKFACTNRRQMFVIQSILVLALTLKVSTASHQLGPQFASNPNQFEPQTEHNRRSLPEPSQLEQPVESYKLPPSASCLMPEPFAASIRSTSSNSFKTLSASFESLLKLNKSSNEKFNDLIQTTQNSLQLKYLIKSGPPSARYQEVFYSICDWVNYNNNLASLHTSNQIGNSNSNPLTALWVYDKLRNCLIAKFIYYSKYEIKTDFASKFAKLTSPLIFNKIPLEHSLSSSEFFSTCEFKFKYYITIKSHLEINLNTYSKGGNNNLIPTNTYQLDTIIIDTKNLPNKQYLNDSWSELLLWQEKIITMPYNLTNCLFYQLELIAMPTILTSGSSQQTNDYLNGIAIANMSLTHQCFGLGINRFEPIENENELIVPINQQLQALESINDSNSINRTNNGLIETEQSSSFQRISKFFKLFRYHLMAVCVIILFLFLFLHSIFFYLNYKRISSAKKTKRFEQNQFSSSTATNYLPKPPKNFLLKLFCCCLDDLKYFNNSRHKPSAARKNNKVYQASASGNNRLGSGQAKALADPLNLIAYELDQDARNNYLRPLARMFENVELNENPSYLMASQAANSCDTNQQQQQQQQAAINSLASASIKFQLTRALESYYVDKSRLTLIGSLGKGAFGEVYKGRLVVCSDQEDENQNKRRVLNRTLAEDDEEESHSREVAVKTLPDGRMSLKDFLTEAINMSLVKHKNIVELIGVCYDEKTLYIIMELLPGGNLKEFLYKNRDIYKPRSHNSYNLSQSVWSISTEQQLISPSSPTISTISSPNMVGTNEMIAIIDQQLQQQQQRVKLCIGDLLVFALDIARACDYLQKKRFVHRDLAARNCLLTASVKRSINQLHSLATPTPTRPGTSESDRFNSAAPSALDVNANHKIDLNQVYLNGYQDSYIVAKLADFGMTRDIYLNDYYKTEHKEMPVRWVAPEYLDGRATTKSDVWSFGVFLWELFSMGQRPYGHLIDNKDVINFIKRLLKPDVGQHKPEARGQINQAHQQPPPPPPTFVFTNSSNSGGTNGWKQNQTVRNGPDTEQDLLLSINSDQNYNNDFDQNNNENSPTNQLSLDEANNYENELILGQPEVELPPLPLPDKNTPMPIYSIMCSCWAINPEERPQFEEIANRLYWCLSMPEVLAAELPRFSG